MKKIINTLPDNNENFEKTINALLNELKSDEEIYRSIKEQNMTVKEVKENIARLIEYKEDHDYCKNCPGIDKCQKQFPHFAKSIRFDKQINYLYVNNVACDKYMEKIKIDSLYERFDAPSEWKGTRLNSLDLSNVRRPLVKTFINILNNNTGQWLYLSGNKKCGKSIILVSFATEYALKYNVNVAVVNSQSIVKQLSSEIFNDKESFLNDLSMLSNVPLLVLDGFGNEAISEFNRDNIIFPLLSNRSDNNLITLIGSDLSLDEVGQLYDVGKNGSIRYKQLLSLIRSNSAGEFDITGISYKTK